MQAIAIFRHAILMITDSIGAALRITLWPYLLILASGVVLVGPELLASYAAGGQMVPAAPGAVLPLMLIIILPCAGWRRPGIGTSCWANRSGSSPARSRARSCFIFCNCC